MMFMPQSEEDSFSRHQEISFNVELERKQDDQGEDALEKDDLNLIVTS
jgi:hypothetical protein